MDFPLLSAMTYLPLAGALLIFFLPGITRERARTIALLAALGSFVLSAIMVIQFDHNAEFQFQERVNWLSGVGSSYHLGVDGLAVLLIALTTTLTAISIGWSWGTVKQRGREYYIAILLLETGMLGVFMALDLFIFYIFWELMLIPMALLIGVWGSQNRIYAAIKFFIYTLVGSLLMLIGIVATYQAYADRTGIRSLDILELQKGWAAGAYGNVFQAVVFGAFFIAFAVKVPMFPFHTWLPDAHVEAPTAASVILAAVMLKMGGYGLLRFNLPLFPEGSEDWALPLIVLSVIAIIYGALVALVQPDMKKLIAYSSVSHMGFVTLGIFVNVLAVRADDLNGFNGAMMVMLAHGFNTGGLFLCVGVIYERAHTRLIARFGGLASRMPVYSVLFGIFMLASIGLPGLSGFVGEFLVALATWEYNPWLAFITFSVVIFAAWYMMWMFQRVVFGRAPGELPDAHDGQLTPGEREMLTAHGHGHGDGHGHGPTRIIDHGHGPATAPFPVSGASHEHHAVQGPEVQGAPDLTIRKGHGIQAGADDVDHSGDHAEHGGEDYPDVNRGELATLLPLAFLTIFFGVYPKPIFEIVQPTFQRILVPFLT
jgi:NADH-quinone oxidoreductase subunit M